MGNAISQLTAYFTKHNISFQVRQKEAPYGIHILNMSTQTTEVYGFYKELDLSYINGILSAGILDMKPTAISVDILGVDKQKKFISNTFPETRLGNYFTKKSALLVEDVISWIKENQANLTPKIYMMNAAFLAILALKTQGEKVSALLTESYAWQVCATLRGRADAMKCKDEDCMYVATNLPFEFNYMLGYEIFNVWEKLRTNKGEFFEAAFSLYKELPKKHTPIETACQGDRFEKLYKEKERFSPDTLLEDYDLFKSEDECIAVEEEVQRTLLEQHAHYAMLSNARSVIFVRS